jgi:hypothetical protein
MCLPALHQAAVCLLRRAHSNAREGTRTSAQGALVAYLLRCDVAVAVHAAEDELHLAVTQ